MSDWDTAGRRTASIVVNAPFKWNDRCMIRRRPVAPCVVLFLCPTLVVAEVLVSGTGLVAATLDVKKRRGVGHPDLLPIDDAAGEILVETDPKQKAESLAEKSIAIREKLQAEGQLDDDALLGRTWLLLARARLAAGRSASVCEGLVTWANC
jgi:hypothetical protein